MLIITVLLVVFIFTFKSLASYIKKIRTGDPNESDITYWMFSYDFKSPLNVIRSELSFLSKILPSIHQGTNSGYFSISRTISISWSFLQGMIFFNVADDIQAFYFLRPAIF